MGRRKDGQNGGDKLTEAMARLGYVRADEAARRLDVSRGMLTSWLADKKLSTRLHSHVRWVSWHDCVRVYGVDLAQQLGIVTSEEAKKIERENTPRKGAST